MRTGTTEVGLSKPPAELARFHRLGRELRVTDQLLTDDLENLRIEAIGLAPAATSLDGKTIIFAESQLPSPFTREGLAVWLGANAHEVGHVLWTPREETPLLRRLDMLKPTKPGIFGTWNILEDQREERLLLGRFAPWEGYLVACLNHVIVTPFLRQSSIGRRRRGELAWTLLAGRTWLPLEVRRLARGAFAEAYGDDVADRVAALVADYQALADPGTAQATAAYTATLELHDLIVERAGEAGIPKACAAVRREAGEAEPGDVGDPSLPPTWYDLEEEADEDGPEGDEDVLESEAQAPEGQEADEDGPEGDDGRTPRQPPPDVFDDLRKAMQEATGKALGDEQTRDDLERIQNVLGNGAGEGITLELGQGAYVEATPEAEVARHVIAEALYDLKEEAEPGWNKRVDSGRFNVRRWKLDPMVTPDTVFDRYDPGMLEATDLEVVLLLDVSGSMDGKLDMLGQAAWAIRHAVEAADGRITTITYSDIHFLLAGPEERVDSRVFVPSLGAGTEPLSALEDAYLVLAGSPATNRVMVMLTDGRWMEGTRESEEVVEALNEAGVETLMVLLGMAAGPSSHRARHSQRIDTVAELPEAFRRLAAGAMAHSMGR